VIDCPIAEHGKKGISFVIKTLYFSVFSDDDIDFFEYDFFRNSPDEIEIQVSGKPVESVHEITSRPSLEDEGGSKIKIPVDIN
jgi:hypothetical protein